MKKQMKAIHWLFFLASSLFLECAYPPTNSKPPESFYLQFEKQYFAYSRDWGKPVSFVDNKLNDSIAFYDSVTKKETKAVYLNGESQGKKENLSNCPPEQRSTEDILIVIRKETPTGLRRIYNKFLYRNRALGGKVTLKFHIMKNGLVFSVLPIGDTTEDPQFVNALSKEVLTWRFAKSNCENYDVVTVPFTFEP